MATPFEAAARLDAFGLDAVCEALADGRAMTLLADDVGVSFGSLSNWLNADPKRSARARDARASAARMWDDMATARIEAAPDAFGLAKAKELAHHYRWRASKIAPREYGDKLDVAHSGEMAVNIVTGIARTPGADADD